MVKKADRIEFMKYRSQTMRNLIQSLSRHDLVSFGGGAPAKEAYPVDQIRKISQDVFREDNRAFEALGYGSPLGLTDLREQIRDVLLKPNRVEAQLNEIMVTAGGIQTMNLLCQLVTNPGDKILVESPTFVHATMIFEMFQIECIPCSIDEDGLLLDELEQKIKQYNPVFIYTMPTFQNPTGVTMSLERRKRIVALAEQYDVLIFEDDPYRQIRYSGDNLPPIKAFDRSGHVIYASSLSKIFAPGARLGYILAAEPIIDHLVDIKTATDTCTNGFSQVICAEFFKRGHYPDHVQRLCKIYKGRRDVMLQKIDESFPEGTKRTDPDGGYYVWVTLPDGLDGKELLQDAIEEIQITYGVGEGFYIQKDKTGNNCIRMCFSGAAEELIEESITKLGKFFCSKIK